MEIMNQEYNLDTLPEESDHFHKLLGFHTANRFLDRKS